MISATGAFAHHAFEFIAVESAEVNARGEKTFYVQYDYMAPDKNDPTLDRWEITPGMAVGITDRLMLDVHTHYAQFGRGHLVDDAQEQFSTDDPSPFLEAVTFNLVYRLTQNWPVNFAVSAGIELPFSRARDLLDAEEVYECNLIASFDFARHSNITLNLLSETEGSETDFEYALGIRTPLSADAHGVAAGIELLGDFDDFENSWSVLPGIYIPFGDPSTVFKTGFEMGKNMEHTRYHFSVMYQF